jgi:sugar lactone lactonase YvrE
MARVIIKDCPTVDRRTLGRVATSFSATILLLAGSAAATGAERTDISIPGDHVFPESITSTSDGTIIIGSLAQGMIFRVPPGGTTAEPWVKPGTNGLMSVIGVLADERSNTLWACSSDLSEMGVTVPSGQKLTALKSFDLKTGQPKGSVPLPGDKTFCNDLAIGPDGAAYVTDSFNPHILRLKPDAKQFEVWVRDDRFGGPGFNLDGIAFGGDGQLYVNTFESGKLFRVAVEQGGASGKVTALQTDAPVDHLDGMRAVGSNSLLVVEGVHGRLDLISVTGNNAKVQTLHDGYTDPVSLTVVGDTAWVLEGQLRYLFDPKFKGQTPKPFRAYPVTLQTGK